MSSIFYAENNVLQKDEKVKTIGRPIQLRSMFIVFLVKQLRYML